MENTDLASKLQDALDQITESTLAHRTLLTTQYERGNKYKRMAEHKEDEGKQKLAEQQQAYDDRESRLQSRIQQLQNQLYLAEQKLETELTEKAEMRQSISQSLMRNSYAELQGNNSMLLHKMAQKMQRDSVMKSQKSYCDGVSFTKEDEYL